MSVMGSLEVRPEEGYRAGHLPGALSVPVDPLEAALQVLPKHKEIVAYCRDPYHVFSDEVVSTLRAQGYRASSLTEGFPTSSRRTSGGTRWSW
jgi:rhodanese-related sulfurtransferase